MPKQWHGALVLGLLSAASFVLSILTERSAPWVFGVSIGGLIYLATIGLRQQWAVLFANRKGGE